MKAVIIGGGIIGLCSAYYLSRAGWEVTIADSTDLSDSCSYGNLGMVVPSHFVPLAAPGIVSQGFRWMFDSKSPFYVKPSLSPRLIRWGWKFIRSANASHVNRSAKPLLDINLMSRALYEEISSDPAFSFSYERKGIMMYFRDPHVAEEEVHLAEKAISMGLDVAALSKEQIQQLEPGVQLDILGGVHYRCDAHLYPNQLIAQMIAVLKRRGVSILGKHELKKVIARKSQIAEVQVGDKRLQADLFIMASGSWLPETMKLAGLNIPLMPGKGYSFTVEAPEKRLNIPAILCEARVAITPMNGRMRYGGTMELGSMNHRINLNRVRGIVESIPAYFPDLNVAMPAGRDIWYGFRPCTPDGLPYIGYARSLDNLIVAGGHAMMGLSLGAATGKLVAELATGSQTSIGISAFDPNRFS